MNVSSWLKKATISRLDAELILANSLGKDRVFLHAHPEFELSESVEKQVNSDMERREKHEPLAYILGYKEFYGRKFAVTPDVLIPRPETEAIINLAKELILHKILDVGTGSGCIAITLKLELPESDVTALDISPKALALAGQNAAQLDAKVAFLESDLLEKAQGKYDLIVANLPYVDKKWDWLSPELVFEPDLALYAKDSGLYDIKLLVGQAEAHLTTGGAMILESDLSQHDAIKDYVEQTTKMTLVKTEGLAQLFKK
jgi:release factor glutamine methyltransferase